jgi:hypothetical protein
VLRNALRFIPKNVVNHLNETRTCNIDSYNFDIKPARTEYWCHTGQFVTYTDSTGTYKGLKINNPWTEWLEDGRYEIGIRLKVSARLYQGDFTQVSTRHLTEEELSELDKETLQIMRNEVYARYGYRFQDGGKMEQYFIKQNWYRPQHDDVTDFLTQVELDNIELIKKIESKK